MPENREPNLIHVAAPSYEGLLLPRHAVDPRDVTPSAVAADAPALPDEEAGLCHYVAPFGALLEEVAAVDQA